VAKLLFVEDFFLYYEIIAFMERKFCAITGNFPYRRENCCFLSQLSRRKGNFLISEGIKKKKAPRYRRAFDMVGISILITHHKL